MWRMGIKPWHLALLLVAILALATGVVLAIIQPTYSRKQANLPVMRVGDCWVYKAELRDFIYKATGQVTEMDIVASKDCYVVEWEYQPTLPSGITNQSVWYDKATDFSVKRQSTVAEDGQKYLVVWSSSYVFLDQEWWPLEVGRYTRVSETVHKTTRALGEGTTKTKPTRETSTYVVERMEEITVPAGTFECFKIVKYDETGKRVKVRWYSDIVKSDVKTIYYESGNTVWLHSYSVH